MISKPAALAAILAQRVAAEETNAETDYAYNLALGHARDAIEALPEEGASYEATRELIRSLPMTWIPALTSEITEVGYAKSVWKPKGASTFVASVEKRLAELGGR